MFMTPSPIITGTDCLLWTQRYLNHTAEMVTYAVKGNDASTLIVNPEHVNVTDLQIALRYYNEAREDYNAIISDTYGYEPAPNMNHIEGIQMLLGWLDDLQVEAHLHKSYLEQVIKRAAAELSKFPRYGGDGDDDELACAKLLRTVKPVIMTGLTEKNEWLVKDTQSYINRANLEVNMVEKTISHHVYANCNLVKVTM